MNLLSRKDNPASGCLRKAVIDRRYLKERGYPDKAALKLVGDRNSLSRVARNCLFRGVTTSMAAISRKSKCLSATGLAGLNLGLDWYNVLFTVESYLKGLPVFISDDALLRDASGVHGSFRSSETTERAIEMIWELLPALESNRVDIFLDSPVAFSGEMARGLRNRARRFSLGTVEALPSADYVLKTYDGVVASSDSVVVDRAPAIFDLPRHVLESRFGFEAPDLLRLKLPSR